MNANPAIEAIKCIAKDLNELIESSGDAIWFDASGQKHPAITPFIRAYAQDLAALARGEKYREVSL